MLDPSMVVIALVITAIASTLIAMVWIKSRRNYRKPFAMLMLSELLIMWSYTFDVSSPTLSGKLFWHNFEYIGYVCAISSFFLFTLQYSSEIKVNRPLAALLGIPSVLTVLAVATNPYHHLFYTSVVLSDDFYRSFDPAYGPLFYAYISYAAVIMISGAVALFIRLVRASNAHRPRVAVTFMAILVIVVPVLVNLSAVTAVPGGIQFATAFLLSDMLLFFGAFSFEIFSMVPFELERVIQQTRGGVFVLDDEDVIMFQNPTAESLTGRKDSLYLGKLTDILPNFPRDVLSGEKESSVDVEDIYEIVPGRFFDVTVLPITDYADRLVGKTVTLREVTAQKKAEDEALEAKHKLDLMNSITRHDVLNQLVIIEGHLTLASKKADREAVQKHIEKCYQAAQNIHRQMQLARDYQDMSKRTPVWQNLEQKVLEASKGLDLKGARLSIDAKGVELLADPLLEKVLYNLMHNSIVHGGKVSNLRFEAAEDGNGLQLIYTDDGAGIDPEMRLSLFTKGAGLNSGLGLFLSKEILSHSNMTIDEEGRPGKGARFVIRVPPARYRNFGAASVTAISEPMAPSVVPARSA